MAEKKLSQLSVTNTISANDRFVLVTNTDSSPQNKIATFTVFRNVFLSNVVPTSANSSGTRGTFAYGNGFLYVCVSSNTWVRIAANTSW